MLLVPEQRTPGWYSARQGRITASLAAAVIGLDPHCGPQAAWGRIQGVTHLSPNRAMQWGNQFEADARRDYELLTGNLVFETGFWVHDRHDWLGASPDGLIGDDGGVEIKCPSVVPVGIPIQHRIQCIVNMLVTGRTWWDYYCWVMSEHFLARIYLPPKTDGLLRRLKSFYDRWIVPNIKPPRMKRGKRTYSQCSPGRDQNEGPGEEGHG